MTNIIQGMPNRLTSLRQNPNISGTHDEQGRERLLNPLGRIDLGYVLSFLDWEAGTFAADNLPEGIGAVTVGVESSTLYAPLAASDQHYANMILTRSGSSSLEIQADWISRKDTGESTHHASFYFTFVAIDKEGKPQKVAPTIIPSGTFEEEITRRSLERKQRNTQSATATESTALTDLISQAKTTPAKFANAQDLEYEVPWYANRAERNLHGITFGGYLMEQMYLHAWNGARYNLTRMTQSPAPFPLVAAVSNVTFKEPVLPGWITHYTVTPVFSSKNTLVQQVSLDTQNPIHPGELRRTNSMTVTFVPVDQNLEPSAMPKQILPSESQRAQWMQAYQRRETYLATTDHPPLHESTVRLMR